MTLLDLTLPAPEENVALDEALLLEAEAGRGPEALRLWELPRYAVVVGAGGSVAIDVDAAACDADGVPVLRRSSGGGTVVLGPGCLCFTLVLRQDRAPELGAIGPSARYVMGRVREALAGVAPGAAIEGLGDLAVDGRKFSGSAQQRKRAHVLYHGTLLGDFDLSRISRWLRPPERQPAYRDGRPHDRFVTTLATPTSALKSLLVDAWGATPAAYDPPMDVVRGLVDERYGRVEWNRRR